MYRVPGLFALAATAILASAGAAGASSGEICVSPQIVTAHYSEQVCYRGDAAGYVACRWIDRAHDVSMPAECAGPTGETPARADRGAYRGPRGG